MLHRDKANRMVKEDPGYSLTELYFVNEQPSKGLVSLTIETYKKSSYLFIQFIGVQTHLKLKTVDTPYTTANQEINGSLDMDMINGNILKGLDRVGYRLSEIYTDEWMKSSGTYF